MSAPIARVAVEWDGRRWQAESVEIEVVETADMLAVGGATIRPRRIEIELDLDGADEWIADGHHPSTARASVWIGSAVVYFGPILQLDAGRDGELSRIVMEDPGLGDAVVPSGREALIRRIDVAETNARREEWREQYQADAADRPRWAQPDKFVFFSDATSERALNRRDRVAEASDHLRYEWVREEDWATASDKAVGVVYPWIIGKPGRETGKPGSLAHVVDVSGRRLMIAGHHGTQGTVTIWGPKAAPAAVTRYDSETFNAVNATDASGAPIMLVDVSASTLLNVDWGAYPEAADAEWYATWDGTASGLPGDAADLIAILLSVTPGAVDYDSIEAARGWLRGYELAGSVEQPVDVDTLLTRHVLPLLPVAVTSTVNGLALVPVRLDATADDAVWRLVEGRDYDVVRPPEYVRGFDPASSITIRHSPDRRSRSLIRSSVVDHTSDARAARSRAWYGPRSEVVETQWIASTVVADRVARLRLARQSVARRAMTVAVDAARYGAGMASELRVGDVVTVRSEDGRLVDAVCLVTSIRRTGGPVDDVVLLLV